MKREEILTLILLDDFILFLCLFRIFKLRILVAKPKEEKTN